MSGTYLPIAGDFNGDGIGDIFWDAVNATTDYTWTGTGLRSAPFNTTGRESVYGSVQACRRQLRRRLGREDNDGHLLVSQLIGPPRRPADEGAEQRELEARAKSVQLYHEIPRDLPRVRCDHDRAVIR